jgi:DNA-binding XRE family transcriptional regulator
MLNVAAFQDGAGRRYFSIFEHGSFHRPLLIIDEREATTIAIAMLGGRAKLPVVPGANEIAHEVRYHRAERGLSQLKLAQKLGISRNYVAQIEAGKAENISIGIYRRIAIWIARP